MPLGSRTGALARSTALAALALLVLTVVPALAQPTPATAAVPLAGGGDALWTPTSATLPASRGAHARTVDPSSFRAYTLADASMTSLLADAPLETARGAASRAVRITVPAPTGELVSFDVEESPVLEAGIQARHPEIRTYAGTAVGFPDSIRLDVTPAGFHAAVRGTGHPSWYVDPAYQGDTGLYVSYLGQDLPTPEQPLVEPELSPGQQQAVQDGAVARRINEGAGGAVIQRTYRLALLSDPNYAEYVAPGLNDGTHDAASNSAVLAAKTTLINRVDEIYNDDLAVKLVLIDGTDKLNLNNAAKATTAGGSCGATACFTTAQLSATGNGCTDALLSRQRFVIGLLAGANNFDIGHFALGINGGGLADLGVVGTKFKAEGCTGLPTPTGDFFAIDYVAHEMGHQFGANHTFQGTTSSCGGGNRNADTSVEPGGGSSVMAYAGICGSDDLQPHSDPYFSERTQTEIGSYVTSGQGSNAEVQDVALNGFDGTESLTLTFDGTTTSAITNGTTYTAAGIKAAVQAAVPGSTVTVSGIFGAGTLTTAGFQLTFGGSTNQPDAVLNVGTGFTGVAGTIDQGGPAANGGHTAVTTSNHNPVVTAAAAKSIPVRTPFALTGSAADADGDPLSYLWEQNDAGGGSGITLASNNKTNGPLFRMFGTYANVSDDSSLMYHSTGENLAGTSPTRVFPDLSQVLAGTTNAATGSCPTWSVATSMPMGATLDCYSEFLPTSAYVGTSGAALHFRLTARDMRAGGGGTAYADTTLTLVSSAGPFLVTSQPSAVTYAGGSAQTVTWAVNGTDTGALAPNVKISFSTDGGQTYPTVLAASTPNDGSETVTIPNVATSGGRIKIEAVDNYFFDVNDAPITVTSSGPAALAFTSAPPATATTQYSDAPSLSFSASSGSVDGSAISATADGLPTGLTLVRTATSSSGTRPGTGTWAVQGGADVAPGSYPVTFSVTDGATTQTASTTITITRENAGVAYTGPTAATTGTNVDLSATVTAAADGTPGDLGTATVTFTDTNDAGATLCTAVVTASGDASCPFTTDTAAHTYAVRSTIGGRYTGASSSDTHLVVTADGGGDTTPPQTSISSGPADHAVLRSDAATFKAHSSESGSTFVCRLDGQLRSCPNGVLTLTTLGQTSHQVVIAAVDAAGNADRSPVARVVTVPVDDTKLKVGVPGFNRGRASNAYLGTYSQARSRGASLTYPVKGARSLVLVIRRVAGGGSAAVYLGSTKLKTVSFAGSGQQLVTVKTFAKATSGTVRIVTGNAKPVRVEGLAVVTK